MSEPKERLKKLYALALRGLDGETEQAQALLEKLSKKYGMCLSDLDEEVEREYHIKYSGKTERRLLAQIVYKVTNEKNRTYGLEYTKSGRTCNTALGVVCTEAQKLEIEFLFDFYKKLLEKETERFFSAFIQKHRLFGNLKEGEEGADISEEELRRMYLIMQGLSDDTPLAQIEGK